MLYVSSAVHVHFIIYYSKQQSSVVMTIVTDKLYEILRYTDLFTIENVGIMKCLTVIVAKYSKSTLYDAKVNCIKYCSILYCLLY